MIFPSGFILSTTPGKCAASWLLSLYGLRPNFFAMSVIVLEPSTFVIWVAETGAFSPLPSQDAAVSAKPPS